MKKLLEIINTKVKPYAINKYIFADIMQNIYIKLYDCYKHDLQNITDQEKREARLCEIVHNHCYNQTWTTKTAIKKIIKKSLSQKQYQQFGLKLIYAILDTGKEITDDPYSPECVTELLSQEIKIMQTDPRLEAIALKVIKKMDLYKDNKHGNIILIVMVIGIILSLIRVIQECNASRMISLDQKSKAKIIHSQVNEICIKRTFMNRWRLRRIIKEKLSAEDHKLYGEKLKNAILDSGSELTEEETFTLVEAANV